MPISRLENFLKNVQGNIIYVDPNEIDSTDSIDNQGNSQTRPFKTIQRALVEAARFSYVAGQRNDKFDQTTIVLSSGTHIVDNRPGYLAYDDGGVARYRTRIGETGLVLSPFGLSSNFDLNSFDNELYKLNSVYGGIIIPRGTSIVGRDLRKTKIRPKYVPDPESNEISPSAIFRVTGACYISNFTIFDADPTSNVYKNYGSSIYIPTFSHHKLNCFEYVDGANPVNINDSFITFSSPSTDLDMYYQKVSDVYDTSSGRPIEPDYPSGSLDFQTRTEEYRIVGPKAEQVGISSIKAGDGSTSSTVITVTTESNVSDLTIDTPIRISGISTTGYNGIHVVSEVVSDNEFKFNVENAPNNPLPTVFSATVDVEVDTIQSASPYLFSLSKRSTYGLGGLYLDGSKVTGFKSGLVAQFTGNALQKDDKAFVRYNSTTGTYDDYTTVENLHLDPEAVYKPSYRSTHIHVSNDAIIQAVSIFAIGHNNQYVAESGAELSLANCNANFGQNALLSDGFKREALDVDNKGYITHVIPPLELQKTPINVDWVQLDVDQTVSTAVTSKLYLFDKKNADLLPTYVVDGYRIGSKDPDYLNVQVNVNGVEEDLTAKIVMPSASGITTFSGEKRYTVSQSVVGVNSITSNEILLKTNHEIQNGESIRVISENGHLPDGLKSNQLYYAITSGLSSNAIKIARSLNDSFLGNEININNNGGELTVISRVSDKKSGDIGHPIQWDESIEQWYVSVSDVASENSIYSRFVGVGTATIGMSTPNTYLTRTPSSRAYDETIYKLRYVIPAGITTARPPINGYIIQESGTTTGFTDSEITASSISNIDDQKNYRFISEAVWNNPITNIITEKEHDLTPGSVVEIVNVKSANNATGIGSSGFNGTFEVVGVTSSRGFTVSIPTNPGVFTSDTSVRLVSNLPRFKKKEYEKTFYIYKVENVKEHIPGQQDGIYHLTCLHSDVSPVVQPFTDYKFSQQVRNLYPQSDRDNPVSDPPSASSFALSESIGIVVTNDIKRSITKDVLEKYISETGIGKGIVSIAGDGGAGLAHTVTTNVDHNLNPVISVGVANSGVGYGEGTATTLYGARLIGVGVGSDTGSGAVANVSVNVAGNITGVTIVSGGGGYGIGNSLAVVGIATTTGHTVGIVTVTEIYSNVGEVLQIVGVRSETNLDYNNTFRVTGVPNSREITFESTTAISAGTITGAAVSFATASISGPSIAVTSLSYDPVTGIATVGTGSINHGLLANTKVRIVGAGQTLYNGNFIVTQKESDTAFQINIGVSTVSPGSVTGSVYAFRTGYSSNSGSTITEPYGSTTNEEENVGSRMTPFYVGITTTLSVGITSTSTSIGIANSTTCGLKMGDYIMIEDELLRISNTNINTVIRGALGTVGKNHPTGSVVRKVKVLPIELRRSSLIRAANQVFEYVGFGQGNYSVALPEKQTKVLTTEERKIGQTERRNGGQNYYTGLNDSGEYFVGNKVIKGTTGEEQIFDAPIPSSIGEEFDSASTTFTGASVQNSIRVGGGPDKNILSVFDGPVAINGKLSSTSEDGIEVSKLYIQGDNKVSRKLTVGISTPTSGGSSGDVTLSSRPSERGFAGWVYTIQNTWRRFGLVSRDVDSMVVSVDKIGIGTTSPAQAVSVVGNVDVTGIVTATGGFISVGNTTPIKITLSGNSLVFTAVGIGSTSLTLS